MKRWYVLQTKSSRENDAARLLSQGHFEVFHPKVREVLYRGKVAYLKNASLFPSYLFLRTDFEIGMNFHRVKYTRCISKILCSEGKPLPVDDGIVQTLQARTNVAGFVDRQVHFHIGDEVRIKKGILKDLVGVIEKPSTDRERIAVLLKLVNYNLRATVHWTECEKVKFA